MLYINVVFQLRNFHHWTIFTLDWFYLLWLHVFSQMNIRVVDIEKWSIEIYIKLDTTISTINYSRILFVQLLLDHLLNSTENNISSSIFLISHVIYSISMALKKFSSKSLVYSCLIDEKHPKFWTFKCSCHLYCPVLYCHCVFIYVPRKIY